MNLLITRILILSLVLVSACGEPRFHQPAQPVQLNQLDLSQATDEQLAEALSELSTKQKAAKLIEILDRAPIKTVKSVFDGLMVTVISEAEIIENLKKQLLDPKNTLVTVVDTAEGKKEEKSVILPGGAFIGAVLGMGGAVWKDLLISGKKKLVESLKRTVLEQVNSINPVADAAKATALSPSIKNVSAEKLHAYWNKQTQTLNKLLSGELSAEEAKVVASKLSRNLQRVFGADVDVKSLASEEVRRVQKLMSAKSRWLRRSIGGTGLVVAIGAGIALYHRYFSDEDEKESKTEFNIVINEEQVEPLLDKITDAKVELGKSLQMLYLIGQKIDLDQDEIDTLVYYRNMQTNK